MNARKTHEKRTRALRKGADMITPIRTLTINQICERKDDLLVSNDDIHKLAKHVKEQAIDEFSQRCKEHIFCQTFGLKTRNIDEIAEQMKGGAE